MDGSQELNSGLRDIPGRAESPTQSDSQASAAAMAGRAAKLRQQETAGKSQEPRKRRRWNENYERALHPEGAAAQASAAAAIAGRAAKLRQPLTPGESGSSATAELATQVSATGKSNPQEQGGAEVPAFFHAQVKEEMGLAVPASLGPATGVGQPFAGAVDDAGQNALSRNLRKVKQEYLDVPQGAEFGNQMHFSDLGLQNRTQSPVVVPASLGPTTGVGQPLAGAAAEPNWNPSVAAAVPASLGPATGVGQPFAGAAAWLKWNPLVGVAAAVPASFGSATGVGQPLAGAAQCQLPHPVVISQAAAVTGQGPVQANGAQNVLIQRSSGRYIGAVNQLKNPHGFGTFNYSIENRTDTNVDIVYEGDWHNGLRHGKGKLMNKNGETYDGMWENDKRHGIGTITDNKGNVVFEGKFVDDKRANGKEICCVIKEVYNGSFHNGLRQGKGTLTSKNGYVYDGEFVNGIKHGAGKETCPNGYYPGMPINHVYEGQFEGDLRHGKGIITSYRNAYYVKFKTGVMISCVKLVHNYKEIKLPEGKYLGTVNQGQPHGEGVLIYKEDDEKNRDYFQGNFVKGKRQGIGRLRWKTGGLFTGNFENDNKNPKGKHTRPDGSCYVGICLNGKAEGHGALTYPHGSKILGHVGQFKNGVEQGEGTRRFVDGTSFKGTFKNGVQDGRGTYTFPSDDERNTYEGLWKNGKRHGVGTLTMKNGSVLKI